jgi:hypothetical protein
MRPLYTKTPTKRPDPNNIRDYIAHLVVVGKVTSVEYVLMFAYMNRIAGVLEKCSGSDSERKVRGY